MPKRSTIYSGFSDRELEEILQRMAVRDERITKRYCVLCNRRLSYLNHGPNCWPCQMEGGRGGGYADKMGCEK